MQIEFMGSGALGDSAIIASKLINIASALPIDSSIIYHHYESENKSFYKNSLIEFWNIIKKWCLDSQHHFNFCFSIDFYPKGQIKEVIYNAFKKGQTILTTKVDNLCLMFLPHIVSPTINDIVIVTDGGNGDRNIALNEITKISKHLNKQITLLGVKKMGANMPNVIDITGKTSLTEAISYVLGSQLVIAPDGLLGYIAFLSNVPNVIYFHESNLRQNYWNEQLRWSSLAFVQNKNIIVTDEELNGMEVLL